jgi:hypothetical protein
VVKRGCKMHEEDREKQIGEDSVEVTEPTPASQPNALSSCFTLPAILEGFFPRVRCE